MIFAIHGTNFMAAKFFENLLKYLATDNFYWWNLSNYATRGLFGDFIVECNLSGLVLRSP